MADINLPQELLSQAFHQAGHVIAAVELEIEVRSVSIVTIENVLPGTRLAPLLPITDFTKTSKAVVQAVEKHSVVRLAGPAAQMVHAAFLWDAKKHAVAWTRWRARWRRTLDQSNDVDTDFAACAAFAWSDCRTSLELDRQLDSLWMRAETMLRDPANWQRVHRLAAALLRHGTMPGWQAVELVKSP